jgi:hypothetical protein
MAKKVKTSKHTYLIHAERKTSQFNQKSQTMRCKIIEAHRGYVLVESLKRYNKKYAGANKCQKGEFKNMALRRINKDQVVVIFDEGTGMQIEWETVRRREGTISHPGRARNGK